MKKRNILLITLLFSLLIIMTGCATTDNYIKKDLKINPEKDIFYILGAGDASGISYAYQNILEKHGLNSEIVYDANIPANTNYSTSSGTGFYISPNEIITNAHVIGDKETVSIIKNGKKYTATVKYCDDINDIALLVSENSNDKYFKIADSKSYDIADPVFVIGYPLTNSMGKNAKITQGIVNAKTGYEDDTNLIQISAPIQAGNSGGPVINYDYEAIGIATASLESTSRQIQNVNYAIKGEILKLLAGPTSSNANDYVGNIDDAMNATVQIVSESDSPFVGSSYLITFALEYSNWNASFIATLRCIDIATKEIIASSATTGTISMNAEDTLVLACIKFADELTGLKLDKDEYKNISF